MVDCGSSKVTEISRVLLEQGAVVTVIAPSQLPAIESSLPDAIIISGNPALIRDTGTEFLQDFAGLCTHTIPVLGICFGHQVLGLLHGAQVAIGKEDRETRQMEVLHDNPLFSGLPNDCAFRQDHTEVVSLPEDFICLARSSHCSNEAMMHNELPVYGVQFHPEVSGSTGRQLIGNFLSLVANCARGL